MIAWVSSWIQGIVVAVIIAVIIEMILPNGNNKKYIKTVIGIYVLFSIVYPLITKISGKTIDISSLINKEQYIDTSYVEMGNKLTTNTNAQIEDVYKERTKNDIKIRLEDKGYTVNNIDVEIELNDEKRYGEINQINLDISYLKENSKTNTTSGGIEKVDINISNNKGVTENNESNNLDEKQMGEIKNLLENIYGVNKENIHIY